MCLPTYTQGLPEQELPGSGGAGRRGTPAPREDCHPLSSGAWKYRSCSAPGSGPQPGPTSHAPAESDGSRPTPQPRKRSRSEGHDINIFHILLLVISERGSQTSAGSPRASQQEQVPEWGIRHHGRSWASHLRNRDTLLTF